MDLYPEFDTQKTNTLILTHHPPLFNPKTPTYTIHSNWDIINGGANEALAETLKLNVISPFDKTTNIGRICKTEYIKLTRKLNLDLLISGDLTQESAVLAKNLDITLIDLGHHSSEVPGLYKLKELLKPLNIKCEVVNIKPWENI